MENEILKKLQEQEVKMEAIWVSVEKSRKYFLVAMWVTLVAVLLPLLGLVFAIPAFLESYSTALEISL